MKILNFLLFAAFLQFSNAYPKIKPILPYNSRIINGEEAQLGELPHQLMLETEGIFNDGFGFRCGAVLLNKLQAFTSAQCINLIPPEEVRLFAGLHNRKNKSESQMIFIKSITISEEWNGHFKYPRGDFAILTFTAPVTFNKNVQPIEWNDDPNDTFVGEKCVISGWGKTKTGKKSDILLKAETYVLSNEDCQNKTVDDHKIYEEHVCVHNQNHGLCGFDMGGPLTCQKNGKPILVGIASWSLQCNTDYPSGFERTSYFKKFISENLIKD